MNQSAELFQLLSNWLSSITRSPNRSRWSFCLDRHTLRDHNLQILFLSLLILARNSLWCRDWKLFTKPHLHHTIISWRLGLPRFSCLEPFQLIHWPSHWKVMSSYRLLGPHNRRRNEALWNQHKLYPELVFPKPNQFHSWFSPSIMCLIIQQLVCKMKRLSRCILTAIRCTSPHRFHQDNQWSEPIANLIRCQRWLWLETWHL